MTLDARSSEQHGEDGTRASPPSPGALSRRFRALAGLALRRRPSTSLTRRILAINILVLAIPAGGFFFLDEYQESLIQSEIEALRVQGEVFAAAIGAGAVVVAPGLGQQVDPTRASLMLRRLTEPTATRARLFSSTGALIADTQSLADPRGTVRVLELPPPERIGPLDWFDGTLEGLLDWLPGVSELPIYHEPTPQRADDYREVTAALAGLEGASIRRYETGGIIISVSVPVQRYRQVVGALMLTHGSGKIEHAMRAVRLDILRVFAVALGVTILLSIYLATTIARPLRRLALAAQRVRLGPGRQVTIPHFEGRRDEIGALSRDLRAMTDALWQRMDAIERFAADVAHEIKNPLTSLRSAVETAARIDDPVRQKKLMGIIVDDVARLDRLISEISDASRIDAELSRDPPADVDVREVLTALVGIIRAAADEDTPALVLDMEAGADLTVSASETRLGQVFRNVILNAQSFSPPGAAITVTARQVGRRQDAIVRVTVDDEGPGIPEANLESIFQRFYSDRPETGPGGRIEKFGTHSGLGLSISRQIVEATGGSIRAENRREPDGTIRGARFTVELPAATR